MLPALLLDANHMYLALKLSSDKGSDKIVPGPGYRLQVKEP